MWVTQVRALMSQAFVADARRLDGHTLRGAAVLFTAINVGPLYTLWAETWPGSPGLGLMIGLTNALWLVSSLFGCYVFARVISEERTQETYGLLLLTGLGPGAFLLAKSVSRVALILLAIAITIPFWFLCVTFGGVMPVQVVACALVLLANLVVVSQIGTLCAACFEGELRPVGSAIACALIYTLVPMVTPSVRPLLGLGGLNIILQPGFNDLVGTLLWSLIAMGIAGALFAIAWGVLARRGPPERRREESPQEWKTWLSLAPGSPLRPRLGRVWQPAITWKEFYESTWGWEWFIAMTFLIGPLFALVFTFGFGNAPGTSSLMAASLLATAAVCDAAAEMFGREVRRQTWDTLRLVPISLGRIFWRKAFGRLAAFIPAGFLLIPGLVLVPEDVEWLVRDVAAKPMFYVLAGLYFVAAGSLTLTVLCYRSVTRNPIDAFVCGAGTLAVTLVLAGGMMSDFDLSALPGVLMFGSAVMIAGLTLLIGRQIRRILEGEV